MLSKAAYAARIAVGKRSKPGDAAVRFGGFALLQYVRVHTDLDAGPPFFRKALSDWGPAFLCINRIIDSIGEPALKNPIRNPMIKIEAELIRITTLSLLFS